MSSPEEWRNTHTEAKLTGVEKSGETHTTFNSLEEMLGHFKKTGVWLVGEAADNRTESLAIIETFESQPLRANRETIDRIPEQEIRDCVSTLYETTLVNEITTNGIHSLYFAKVREITNQEKFTLASTALVASTKSLRELMTVIGVLQKIPTSSGSEASATDVNGMLNILQDQGPESFNFTAWVPSAFGIRNKVMEFYNQEA